MMAVRLIELRRVLKKTGSIYIHCDPTASHYVKIFMDSLFGAELFRSEITWKRSTSHGNVSKKYGSLTDIILFYTYSLEYCWNQQFHKFTDEYVASKFSNMDQDGRRWQSVSLRNPGPRPNLQYLFTTNDGREFQPHPNGWAVGLPKMKQYEAEKRLHYPKKEGGTLRLKQYLDERPGTKLQNLWTDIAALNSQAKERLGYPTQKPIDLLERIIATSSNAGDVVLDPFCGCGTTVHAAEALGRNWIGIDVTHYAVTLIENRLKAAFGDIAINVKGRPADLSSAHDLARRDRYQFEWWAAWLIGAQAYEGRKGADRGIDGNIFFANGPFGTGRVIVSVKSGANVGVAMVRDLRGTLERDDAELGLLISLHEPTEPMRKEAVAAGFIRTAHGDFPRLQIFTVADWFDGRRPKLPRPITFDELPAPPKREVRESPQMAFRFLFKGGGPKDLHVDPSVLPLMAREIA